MSNRYPSRSFSRLVLCGFAILAVTPLAHASESSDIDLGATVFVHWGYDMKPTPYEGYVDGDPRPNAVDIDRAFFHVGSQLDDTFSVRLQTDVARDESGKMGVLIRNAYLQVDLVDDVKLQFGSADNPMNLLSTTFWDHRWLSKSLGDENDSVQSADLGVYFVGEHADGLLGWSAAVVNGEGYDELDTDYDKALQVRFTVDPLHGDMKLPISIYASQDVYTHDDIEGHTVLMASLGFDHEFANIWGEYILDHAGDAKAGGMSFSVVGKIKDLFNVVGRYDTWDPNKDDKGDEKNTLIAGVTRHFNDHVSLGLTFEHITYKADPKQPHKGIFFRVQAGF